MKYINALFIASLLLTVSVFGQSKNVLADGNPPLTQTMVNRLTGLMEWSLNAELSAEERSQLRSVVISYWTNGDEKSIRSILDTLAFEQKLAGASEEQKRNLQPQVRQKMLEAMEKDATEPFNKVLLAAYRRNQSPDNPNIAAFSGNSPADLVGRWQVRHGNSLSTQNVYTGAIGDGNAMIAEYNIKPDGSVIFSFMLSQNNYGCVTKIKTSKTGRVRVSGARAVFSYERGTTESSDTCNKQYNYTKNLGVTSETLDFTIKTENGKRQFCFSDGKLKDCAERVD